MVRDDDDDDDDDDYDDNADNCQPQCRHNNVCGHRFPAQ